MSRSLSARCWQAMAHSMGLSFPDLVIQDLKLIAEPMRVDGGETVRIPDLGIRLIRKEATVS